MRQQATRMGVSFQLAVADRPLTEPKIVRDQGAPGAVAVLRRYWAANAALMSEWRRRTRSRGELAKFSDLELWDIAVSRDARDFEVRKPFWCT
jgi:uncharacterized protein YjiS (DUF1127 family)